MPRVAIYARVSDPRDGRQHPEIQSNELREYAHRARYTPGIIFDCY
jgi:DNA invertase Pin-like site-specific DNA recombinase